MVRDQTYFWTCNLCQIERGENVEVFASLKPVNSCETLKKEQMDIERGADAEVFVCLKLF